MHKQSSPQVDGWNLYTPSQRIIRDRTVWTKVQGILAPLQFAVCIISLFLVVRYLSTGEGYYAATVSIIIKSFLLFLIMITGAIWEKVVFRTIFICRSFLLGRCRKFFCYLLPRSVSLCLISRRFLAYDPNVRSPICLLSILYKRVSVFEKAKIGKTN